MPEDGTLDADEPRAGLFVPEPVRVSVEQAEHGREADPTDGRRRCRSQVPLAHPDGQRRAHHRAVLGEVGHPQ